MSFPGWIPLFYRNQGIDNCVRVARFQKGEAVVQPELPKWVGTRKGIRWKACILYKACVI